VSIFLRKHDAASSGHLQILESVYFDLIFLKTALLRSFQAMQKASDFCTKEERASRHTEGMLLLEAALGHDDPVLTDASMSVVSFHSNGPPPIT
jgi:hypothetical protein